MKPITYSQVRQVTAGRPLTPGARPDLSLTGICTDTRAMQRGSLYVALRGDRFDGHQFLQQAADHGALAALVETAPAVIPMGLQVLHVPNTRIALGKLAAHVRRQFSGRVVAIGGSNGKTGTKHLVDSVLRSRFRGSVSPKSFNNDIGVPLTIFAADPGHHYLGLELGTNHPGELRALTHIAQPDVAVITNCSAEHLEFLGSLHGVRAEESSIIEGLDPQGLLIVHGDDPDLLELVAHYPGNRVTFGLGSGNDLYATHVLSGLDGVRFRLNGRREVFIPQLGGHVAVNALAAIAVGRRFGMTEDQIVGALAVASGPEMRLQMQKTADVTIINDAYNANPASVKAGLETLSGLPARARRVAVLGDMRELGEHAEGLHREIGRYAATLSQKISRLICVGEKAGLIADAAMHAGFPADHVSHLPDTATAVKVVPEWITEGDLVLLKASRSMRLEKLAEAIHAAAGRRAAS